ncbi:hypothetical protein FRC04_010777 [Tulasnella sp. 424]|nr:hypothetical protein FRC04_010777 [Tulasnella sp. 424]
MSLTGPNSIPKSLSVVWGNILDASDEDAEEAIAFLKGLVRDIRFENTDEIVLRERGFPPLARRDQALKGHNCSHCSPRGHALQHSAWVLSGQIIRQRDPRRLHECLDELEIVEWFRRIHLFDPPGSKHTITLRIYLAAALDGQEKEKQDDDRILRLLDGIESQKCTVGERLLMCSVEARTLRRLGRISHAETTESDLADYIREGLRMGIPTVVKRHILRHDETWEESVIGRTLGLDCFDEVVEEYVPGKGWTATKTSSFSFLDQIPNPPAEVDKGKRIQCWVSGCRVETNLKRCTGCGKGLYCSQQHQQFAWRRHKKLCKSL